ncbi:hypothetical protein [Desulfuribacillus alkaliarsenatis]|uniref:Uncharacterized protein n=1 Tax=Desulfuribacillus alkaliarsenatis TaxID=766136 RepID=A0A1E5G366_9FIRM|nr:hypothetical protein [Desulfuribacillus alkaliarsenatis]OEF97410.1 hypothetical protein BHF68_04165 [Desulfuribacillus alkaliarsenatis]
MLILKHRLPWLIGLGVAIISFMLLYIGVSLVLNNDLTIQNIFAFLGFSILAGIIVSLMLIYKFHIAATIFMLGLTIGFIQMYQAFWDGMTGWGDLIGILTLFIWSKIGLALGFVMQFAYYLYKKLRP